MKRLSFGEAACPLHTASRERPRVLSRCDMVALEVSWPSGGLAPRVNHMALVCRYACLYVFDLSFRSEDWFLKLTLFLFIVKLVSV